MNNPAAPVYIVNGAAGCREHLTGGFHPPAPAWSRTRILKYGYAEMIIHNSTHLEWLYMDDETNQQIDQFMISKLAN